MTEELNVPDEQTQERGETERVETAEVAERVEIAEVIENVEEPQEVNHTEETTTTEEANENADFVEEVKKAEDATEPTVSHRQTTRNRSVKTPNTEDFNWDELGKQQSGYTSDEHKHLEDIYNETFNSIVEQEVVMGTVVAKNIREVVVNIGFKSDGVLPASELRYLPDLKIGDQVEVYVESQEDAAGQLLLSHKKARMLKSWEKVVACYESGDIIQGYVKSKTKGGLIVDVFNIEAFLPGSQIDVKPIRDYDIFVDKTMEFKIVKVNHEFRNIVVSHKALIESELEAQRFEIMSELEKGQVLEGVVKNITNYGAFIDLGGVDGLVHITDLSWGRVNDPKDVLELDQKLNVVILDFDETKKRIALGIKQLTPHPWDALDANLTANDHVKGKVVVVADYGAFVEVLPGVEGLVHVSEMSWSQHLRSAQDFLKVGDEVETVILTLDREERKMSLGIKQLIPDPWITIADKYPVGSRHTAIVRNFTIFGIFVELEEGVDGLIHISDLSWFKKIKHPAEFTRIGEKIDVVVLEMDAGNRRLSLGHKQLEDNPWEEFENIYTVGSIHRGTVMAVNDKGAIISFQGLEGFSYNRSLQRVNGTYIKVGESDDMKVTEFSKENKRIIVSHARIWQDLKDAERENEEPTEIKNKATEDNSEKSTLGDLDALVSLKADLEEAEGKSQKKTAGKQKVVVEETPFAVDEAQLAFEGIETVVVEQQEIAEEPKVATEEPEVIRVTNEIPDIVEDAVQAEEKPKKTRVKKAETEVVTEEKPKKTRAKKAETEVVAEEKPKKTRAKKAETEVVAEEKPKKTRAKKAETEVVATEEKPKKTRAKKAETEVVAEEKPKKTRAKKSEEKSEEAK